MYRSLAMVTLVLTLSIVSQETWGRGFGGARGGGFRGGEMGGARGGEMGGFRGGEMGGARGGEMGGFRGGEVGGARGGEFGERRGEGTPSRGEMDHFLGLPSDGGMHAASSSRSRDGFTYDRGAVEGPRGGMAAGSSLTGPRGNTVDRGAAVGHGGGVAAGRGVEGAGGARAGQGVAAGADGRVAAGGVARGADGGVAARGVAGDRYGAVGGFGYMSASTRYGQAYGVRAGFRGGDLYTRGWYGAHPGAWAAAGVADTAWRGAGWGSLYGWTGASAQPFYYDYGNNLIADGDNVYFNGQDVGTSGAYYDQAASLAQAGAATPVDQNWLPLGVFVMTRADQTNSNMTIQLAVSKQGVLRGNFTDSKLNETQPVQGSVDKETQRVAWTIGKKTEDVMDTGLYNLTKDEVPTLLHYGKDRTEPWLLVRVKQEAPQPSN